MVLGRVDWNGNLGEEMRKNYISITILIAILTTTLLSPSIFAQSPQISNGLSYLTFTQNPDGSWNGTIYKGMLSTTVTTIETLAVLGQENSSNYTSAVLWLQSQDLATTDYLSERIHALSVAGTDLNLLLSYIDQLALIWGGYENYEANSLDTVLALQALRKINYQDQNIISSALYYLTNNQNADGGFGFYQGDESNVYMTALVSSTLQQFPRTTSLATAINKATDYLIAHQNTDGGFRSGGVNPAPTSTIYETALAYIALADVTTDATVMGNAINYLTFTQSPNSSWNDDPYSTALALKALYLWENMAIPPQPNTGTVTGKVVDAYTNQPLSGAVIILQSNASYAVQQNKQAAIT